MCIENWKQLCYNSSTRPDITETQECRFGKGFFGKGGDRWNILCI